MGKKQCHSYATFTTSLLDYSGWSARATGRLVHKNYTSTKMKTRTAKFVPATTKVAKPKCVGGIETKAQPLGITTRKASGQAHSYLPMI